MIQNHELTLGEMLTLVSFPPISLVGKAHDCPIPGEVDPLRSKALTSH